MKTMRADLFDLLFGCWHTKLSFPISVRPGLPHRPEPWRTGTYIVCLDCGREFAYDWPQIKTARQEKQRANTDQASKSRVA